jgi:hypothetical protein
MKPVVAAGDRRLRPARFLRGSTARLPLSSGNGDGGSESEEASESVRETRSVPPALGLSGKKGAAKGLRFEVPATNRSRREYAMEVSSSTSSAQDRRDGEPFCAMAEGEDGASIRGEVDAGAGVATGGGEGEAYPDGVPCWVIFISQQALSMANLTNLPMLNLSYYVLSGWIPAESQFLSFPDGSC